MVSDAERAGSRGEALSTMDAICEWLAATPLSQTIAGVGWIIPAVQSAHILAVATVLTSVLMIDRRLIQAGGRDPSMAWVARRFLPFVCGRCRCCYSQV